MIADRLGKKHSAGDMVYVYYDTYTEEYIVLDKYEQPTPTVYGTLVGTSLLIEGIAGVSDSTITIGNTLTVANPMGLKPPTGCQSVRAVAVKFTIAS